MSDFYDDFPLLDEIIDSDYDIMQKNVQELKRKRHSATIKYAMTILIIVIIIFLAWVCEAVALNTYQNERLGNIKEELIGNAYSCKVIKYSNDNIIIQTGKYYVSYKLCFLKNGTVEYYRATTSTIKETPSWSYVGTYDYSLSMPLLGKCKIYIQGAGLAFEIELSSDGSPKGLSGVS